MKRLVVLSLIAAGMVLMSGFSTPTHAQSPTPDDTPAFYRLVPGTYVQGVPRFTVHYPKDWVEQRTTLSETFRVAPPGAPVYAGFRSPALFVVVAQFKSFDPPIDVPLDKYAEWAVSGIKPIVKDVKLIYNRPSRLRDGTPAYEYETALLFGDRWSNSTSLVTMRGDFTVAVRAEYGSGKITEDLKAMLYSLEFDGPGYEEPVKVPPDVREFLDTWANDALSHDVARIMTHYSDRYLNSGDTKAEAERVWRWDIKDVASSGGPARVTDFVPAGDKAYLTGSLHFKGLKAAKGGCGV
jgi:hypothetical protein